ncbi:MAG: hypothetical protein IPI25_05505 [Candidatus Brocadia sp.]|nr:MAG: hypothetical protein IPI25_05505 [Candidatus Brocadia sp.]
MTKIIFKEQYQRTHYYRPWDNRDDIFGANIDAVLLIGDNAMKMNEDEYITLDLGQAWFEYTGLPFVYAVWVVKKGHHIPGINKLLRDAKEAGIRSVKALATIESQRLQLTQERCQKYLTNSIRYNLGKEEIKGLQTFYQHATSLGLAPEGMEIVLNKS